MWMFLFPVGAFLGWKWWEKGHPYDLSAGSLVLLKGQPEPVQVTAALEKKPLLGTTLYAGVLTTDGVTHVSFAPWDIAKVVQRTPGVPA